MRARRRFVPQVDFLLCRIAPDAGAAGAVVDPSPTVVASDTQSSDLAVSADDDGPGAMDTQLPDDTGSTTATPVLPVNCLD
jgi:hypothetical protein